MRVQHRVQQRGAVQPVIAGMCAQHGIDTCRYRKQRQTVGNLVILGATLTRRR